METIELTVDESLLAEVDRATQQLSMTRADFARIALELALRNQKKQLRWSSSTHKVTPVTQSNPTN